MIYGMNSHLAHCIAYSVIYKLKLHDRYKNYTLSYLRKKNRYFDFHLRERRDVSLQLKSPRAERYLARMNSHSNH